MPIFEFQCKLCGHIVEEVTTFGDRLRSRECPQCDKITANYIPSAHGGYKMVSGDSSTRPKGAGSFKGKRK